MNILGIHGGITINQHDAAAALIVDGSLVCCIEEEGLVHQKFPTKRQGNICWGVTETPCA